MRSYLRGATGEFGIWAFVMAGLTALVLSTGASAATYNFYFNNTEQGDNSTASPALNVQDGKNVSPTPQETPAAQPTPLAFPDAAAAALANASSNALKSLGGNQETPVPAAPDAAGASLANASSASLNSPSGIFNREYRPFRLMVGAAAVTEQGTHTYISGMGTTESYEDFGDMRFGGAASLALYLSRRSAVNFFGGMQQVTYSDTEDFYPTTADQLRAYAGVELELMPIHLSLFGVEDIFEAGILLGATTLRKAPGNIASAQAGVRLNFNFGNDWGLTAAGRANMGFIMAEAGLAFRI
ncbi:MAG: hypothetical protein A2X94_01580 [Bdellovibrionales bacterium GWB1_55_8]|nr:MAG: hypothetical protein A2X94_01580 [Bdellovibrionales bacterium GWB1_55_8]